MKTHTLASTHSHQPVTMSIVLQRLEGLAIGSAALAIYASHGFSWLSLLLLLLVPDLAALGYLVNTRVGNLSYNLAHTLVFPVALALLSALMSQPIGLQLALIWLVHIGMDRTVGYGFKEGELLNPIHRSNRGAR